MNVSDFFPRHEVGGVGHPAMGHEERGAESQLLQQWCDKGSMRFDRVVECQNHYFVARSFLRTGCSVSILRGSRSSSEKTQDNQETQEAAVSDVVEKNCKH
jgi:hypothetical protein